MLNRSDLFYPNIERYEGFLVSVDDITSAVAYWAVQQSPYDVPDDLSVILQKLADILKPPHSLEPLGFRKIKDIHELQNIIRDSLRQIPEYLSWNERKNGDQRPYSFADRYSPKPHPDDDFVDLGALERNAALLIAQRSRLDTSMSYVNDQPLQDG